MKPSTKATPKLPGMTGRIQRAASEFVDGIKTPPNPFGLWRRQLYKDGSSIVETRAISKEKAEKVLALWLAAPELLKALEQIQERCSNGEPFAGDEIEKIASAAIAKAEER